MNIVYGGTFNPPTIAHKEIVDILKIKFKPENIIIVPTYDNYTWKENNRYVDRFNMAKLCFSDCIISNIEQNDSYKGTYYILNQLSKTYNDLYFCLGQDNIYYIKKWINYDLLLKNYKIILISRGTNNIEEHINNNLLEYKDNIIIVNYHSNISSSLFRKTKNKTLVLDEVYKYIVDNNLYEVK